MLLGKKPPKLSKPFAADATFSRGIAAGSMAERRRRAAAGQEMYSEEEMAKWRLLSVEEVDDFLSGHQPLFVHSTNVSMAQYFPEEQKMMVEFLSGAAYIYSNVSLEDAKEFVRYSSKGSAIWDLFRVRGTKKGHKKPYVRIR